MAVRKAYPTWFYRNGGWAASAYPLWAASTSYSLGDIVRMGTYTYLQCTQAGTSGSSAFITAGSDPLLSSINYESVYIDNGCRWKLVTGLYDTGWLTACTSPPSDIYDPPKWAPYSGSCYILLESNATLAEFIGQKDQEIHFISCSPNVYPPVKQYGAVMNLSVTTLWSFASTPSMVLEGFDVRLYSHHFIGSSTRLGNAPWTIDWPEFSLIDSTVTMAPLTAPSTQLQLGYSCLYLGQTTASNMAQGIPYSSESLFYWENVKVAYVRSLDIIILAGTHRIVNFELSPGSCVPKRLFSTSFGLDIDQTPLAAATGGQRDIRFEYTDFTKSCFDGVRHILEVPSYNPVRITFYRCQFRNNVEVTGIVNTPMSLGQCEVQYLECSTPDRPFAPGNLWAEYRGCTLEKVTDTYRASDSIDLWGNHFSYRVVTLGTVTGMGDFVRLPDVDFTLPSGGTYMVGVEVLSSVPNLTSADLWTTVTTSTSDSGSVPSLTVRNRSGTIALGCPSPLITIGRGYDSSTETWVGGGGLFKYSVKIKASCTIMSDAVLGIFISVPDAILYYSPVLTLLKVA